MLLNPPPTSPPLRKRLAATAAVVLAFAIPAAVLIPLQLNGGPRFDDQNRYHVPTIWEIASSWPNLDVNAYTAAMTPGYHVLMAGVARAGGGLLPMQALTALLTCGFVGTLAWTASRRAAPPDAVLLCLPAVFSPYIFTAGIAAVPHNLAWWGVLAVVLLALRPGLSAAGVAGFALVFTALVLVMQSQAWVLAPMVAGAWFVSKVAGASAEGPVFRRRFTRTAAVLLAALPAALILLYFAKQWGGLAPRKQEWVRPVGGVNLASIVMILATCGALGAFYLGLLWRRSAARWAIAGAAIAAIIAAIPATTYDADGRWGGLWNLARATPAVGEHSPVIIALAALGGLVLGALLSATRGRDRWILSAALAGFIAAHSTINQAWQRYYEPMILITLVVAASQVDTTGGLQRLRLSRILLVTITLIQIGLTAMSLRG